MNLRDIIEKIASEADDFLAGASNRGEAKAGVYELINADFFSLTPDERKIVAEGVMAILEDEGFFEAEPGGGSAPGDSVSEED